MDIICGLRLHAHSNHQQEDDQAKNRARRESDTIHDPSGGGEAPQNVGGIVSQKKKNGSQFRLPFQFKRLCSFSEAEMRSKGDSQVVLRAPEKIEFIANFSAQADRPPEALNTNAGIGGEASAPVGYTTYRASDARVCIVEVHEANFSGHKEIRLGGTKIELRPEETVQWASPGCNKGRIEAIGTGCGGIPCEVVGHFRFYAGKRIYVKTHATTGSNKVDGVSSVVPIVISEGSKLDVVLRLREDPAWRSNAESQTSDQCNSFHECIIPS
jgi:hypothetical protein